MMSLIIVLLFVSNAFCYETWKYQPTNEKNYMETILQEQRESDEYMKKLESNRQEEIRKSEREKWSDRMYYNYGIRRY